MIKTLQQSTPISLKSDLILSASNQFGPYVYSNANPVNWVMLMTFLTAICLISIGWHFIEMLFFSFSFRRRYRDVWVSLGCPELFGMSGQIKFLFLALGFKKLPADVETVYHTQFIRIRVLHAVAFASSISLAILITLGNFPPSTDA